MIELNTVEAASADAMRKAQGDLYASRARSAQRRIDQDFRLGRQPAKDDTEKVMRNSRLAAIEYGGLGTATI